MTQPKHHVSRYSRPALGLPHQIVYSVVDSDEVRRVVRGIHEIDPKSFVNAFKTDFVSGYWYERPED